MNRAHTCATVLTKGPYAHDEHHQVQNLRSSGNGISCRVLPPHIFIGAINSISHSTAYLLKFGISNVHRMLYDIFVT